MSEVWLDPGSHAVRFYESETAAHDSIADFFTAGECSDDPLVLVSRPHTFEAVAGLLASGRYGPPITPGRIKFSDVETVLAQFMRAGALDPARCEAYLGQLLSDIRGSHARGTIRLFGEAAGVLCERGLFDDAVALESIVSRLSGIEPRLTVFCGYSLTHFRDDASALLYRTVCSEFGAPTGADPPAQSKMPRNGNAKAPPQATVYVIDDDASIRNSLSRLLKLTEWQGRTFDSAEAFLTALNGLSPGCLVVDIQLGGMSGLDLLDHMRTARPTWPAIAMSGSHNERAEREALRLGARKFLHKPFDPQLLLDAIAQALA